MDQKEVQVKPENQEQQLQVRGTAPHFRWPTSKPGPQATAPPPGQKPMPKRTDQVVEIGYNQETGVPSTDHPLRSMPDASLHGTTGFDQLQTAQQAMKKRRK
ncbi:MAG: hypothetical protein ACJ797_05075 [Ktedonobacteraceae bacterium]